MCEQLKYYLKKFIRQGFTFDKILKELQKSQYLPSAMLEELQNEKLQKIVQHCYKNVPYYTELFNNLGLKPEDIKTKKDLEKLPFLDKYIVKENYDKLIAKNAFKFLCSVGTTSGTTGTPGRFLRDYYSINFENAALQRLWKNAGDNNLRRLTLRENIVVPTNQEKPPFWKYNRANNELIMSSYHLLQKNAQIYIDKILEFKPEIFYTQPPTAYMLAKFFENSEHKISFKAIFTSSENLSDEQRAFIEKVFSCRIYDEYGQAERVASIMQCEKGSYHILEDYSIVELIPNNGGYEVCGTHLHNYAMPLLRYKTGDFVTPVDKKCDCGRNFRVVESIQGRTIYYILTPENNKIVNLGVITSDINNIIETQYIQEKIDELTINVVVNDKFNENDEKKLIQNALNYTSEKMKVTVKKVDSIKRSKNGKFINVIRNFSTDENNFFNNNQ